MAPFRTSLSEARPEVRLLRFLHNGDGDDETIHLELRTAFLDDEDTHYWALSYVWGDEANQATVYVNDHPLAIRRNLYDALSQLRKNHVHHHNYDSNDQDAAHAHAPCPLWFWIDSISINQSDLGEKTHQVSLMRSIYGGAEMVHLWLGRGTEESDMAMDFIHRFGPRALEVGFLDALGDPKMESMFWRMMYHHAGSREEAEAIALEETGVVGKNCLSVLFDLAEDVDFRRETIVSRVRQVPAGCTIADALTDIMTRDYWHRIWMVQEVTLARRAVVVCGTKAVSLDLFDAALSAVSESKARRNVGLSGVFYECIPLRIRRRLVYGKVEPTLADVLMQYVAPPERPFYSASNPRDLIFGILGIMSDEERQQLGVHVDYRKTIVDVFTEATAALLARAPVHSKRAYDAFSLDWCCPRSEPVSYDGIELPSWACDWPVVGRYGIRTWPVAYSNSFRASGGRRQQLSSETRNNNGNSQVNDDDDGRNNYLPSSRPEVLRRRGCRVAIVTEVMEPPKLVQFSEWAPSSMPDELIPDWLSTIRDFVQLGPQTGPGEDYVWRTVQAVAPDEQAEAIAESEELLALVRRIWRRTDGDDPIPTKDLTSAQLDLILNRRRRLRQGEGGNENEDEIQDMINEYVSDLLRAAAASGRHRTLFKTNKLMLGLGHNAVRPGDVVTLIWGEASAFILRPRTGGDFTFVGDAYVDGIMQGEFLNTEPEEEVFDIY